MEFDRGVNGELGNLGLKILQKKFESYNQVWIGALQEEYSHHGYGASGMGMDMGMDMGIDGMDMRIDRMGMGSSSHALADEHYYSEKVSVCFLLLMLLILYVLLLLLVRVRTIVNCTSTYYW